MFLLRNAKKGFDGRRPIQAYEYNKITGFIVPEMGGGKMFAVTPR